MHNFVNRNMGLNSIHLCTKCNTVHSLAAPMSLNLYNFIFAWRTPYACFKTKGLWLILPDNWDCVVILHCN